MNRWFISYMEVMTQGVPRFRFGYMVKELKVGLHPVDYTADLNHEGYEIIVLSYQEIDVSTGQSTDYDRVSPWIYS